MWSDSHSAYHSRIFSCLGSNKGIGIVTRRLLRQKPRGLAAVPCRTARKSCLEQKTDTRCTHLLNICSAVICEQGHQHQPASKPAVLICGASCHPANRKHSPASQHRDHPHCTPTHAEADENGQIATAGRRRVRKTPKTAEVEVEAETLKMLSNENWPMSRALALVITE